MSKKTNDIKEYNYKLKPISSNTLTRILISDLHSMHVKEEQLDHAGEALVPTHVARKLVFKSTASEKSSRSAISVPFSTLSLPRHRPSHQKQLTSAEQSVGLV